MMSDRSSVIKTTYEIIDEWRTMQLKKDMDKSEFQKLNLFYCSCACPVGISQ